MAPILDHKEETHLYFPEERNNKIHVEKGMRNIEKLAEDCSKTPVLAETIQEICLKNIEAGVRARVADSQFKEEMQQHYLPVSHVFNESSTSTPVRIVTNNSFIDENRISLSTTQMKGENRISLKIAQMKGEDGISPKITQVKGENMISLKIAQVKGKNGTSLNITQMKGEIYIGNFRQTLLLVRSSPILAAGEFSKFYHGFAPSPQNTKLRRILIPRDWRDPHLELKEILPLRDFSIPRFVGKFHNLIKTRSQKKPGSLEGGSTVQIISPTAEIHNCNGTTTTKVQQQFSESKPLTSDSPHFRKIIPNRFGKFNRGAVSLKFASLLIEPWVNLVHLVIKPLQAGSPRSFSNFFNLIHQLLIQWDPG